VLVVVVVLTVVVVGGGAEVGCCCCGWVVVMVVVLVGLVVVAAVVVVVGRARTPGSRRRSSWKCTRAATRSLENSRAEWVRAWMGAVKRGQRAVQAWRKEGSVREAARASASWTAAVKRAQRSAVSCSVVLGRAAGGVPERMAMKSVLV
jgi:hypothetical protein